MFKPIKNLIEAIKYYKKFNKAKKEIKKLIDEKQGYVKEVRKAVEDLQKAILNFANILTPYKDIALDIINKIENIFKDFNNKK